MTDRTTITRRAGLAGAALPALSLAGAAAAPLADLPGGSSGDPAVLAFHAWREAWRALDRPACSRVVPASACTKLQGRA